MSEWLDDRIGGIKVQDNGAALPRRGSLNLVGATVVDDPANNRVTVQLLGAATDVNPTPDTIALRDGSGGLKAAYLDSGAASNLLLKRNGTTLLTLAAAAITATVGIVAPSFTDSGVNPATTGLLRAIKNTVIVAVRKADNSANLNVIQTDAANSITLGDATTAGLVVKGGTSGLYYDTSVLVFRELAGTERARLTVSASLALTADAAVTSFAINQTQHASAAGNAMSMRAQRGFTGLVGGTLTLGGGDSGTIGTVLAGSTDIELGDAIVSGNSARMNFRRGAGGVFGFIEYQSATYLHITGTSHVSIEAAAGILSLGATSTLSFSSSSGFAQYVLGTQQILYYDGSSVLGRTDVYTPAGAASITYGPTVTGVTYTQGTRSGTGANAGAKTSLLAQAGQLQTGANANNNGGILELRTGAAGTGGSGAAGNPGSFVLGNGGTDTLTISRTSADVVTVQIDKAATATIRQEDSSTVAGKDLIVAAQGTSAVNLDGGILHLRGGARNGTGLKGGIRLQLNFTTDTMLEAVEIAAGRRVLCLVRGSNATTTVLPANTGDRVVWVAEAGTVPSASCAEGFLLYSDGGLPATRSTAGTTLRWGANAATATGGAGTLPANPNEFLIITVNGNARKIPLYNT